MIRFFYTVFLLGILPLMLFSTCQQASADAKQQALMQAREADDQEMINLFRIRMKALDTLPFKDNSETLALNLALDESSADKVNAILAQLSPDNPLDNGKTNIKPVTTDSLALDSLLESRQTTILNGAMLMGVPNYDDAYKKLRELVGTYQAKIESEEERTTDFRLENTLIIRLSPAQFTEFVAQVRSLAVEVREKRLWEQDLNTQFVDLKARLKAKYEAKRRLEQFIRAARNSNEVLPIQRALDTIVEEIEAVTRTARALTKRTVSSTLTITFYQEVMESKPQEANFGDRFMAGAKDGWVNFKEFLILVALNWPYVTIGMIFLLVSLLAIRSSRRRSRQFKMQAMQIQQQWILQQQNMQQSGIKKNTGSGVSN